jgi:hypothetical protein
MKSDEWLEETKTGKRKNEILNNTSAGERRGREKRGGEKRKGYIQYLKLIR